MDWKKFIKELVKKVVPMVLKVICATLELLGTFISKEYKI